MAGGVIGRTRGETSLWLGCNNDKEIVRVEEDKGVGAPCPFTTTCTATKCLRPLLTIAHSNYNTPGT